MTHSSEESLVPEKRPLRRRTVDASEEATPRRIISSARKVAATAKKTEQETPTEPSVSVARLRKAPTPLEANREASSEKKKQFTIVAIVLMVGMAASAGVGFLDKGQINVQQTIEDRNERIRTNQADERDVLVSQVEIPVQDTTTQGKVDGGLIGRGTGGENPEPLLEVASTTATSSELMASSTELMGSTTESVVEFVEPETTEAVTEVPLE